VQGCTRGEQGTVRTARQGRNEHPPGWAASRLCGHGALAGGEGVQQMSARGANSAGKVWWGPEEMRGQGTGPARMTEGQDAARAPDTPPAARMCSKMKSSS
jgi:hypothetical protein